MNKLSIIETIILGIVQGIAEFLPISSSAHLIIFREVFGIGTNISHEMELSFDIALHLGTLLAIGVFFFNDFIKMIGKGFTKGVKDKDGKILWYLVAATIPAAVAGLLFEDIIDKLIRGNLYIIATALAVMGVIIFIADKKGKNKKEVKDMTLKDALIVGCAQVFALIPGFSRSGTTIAAARTLGIERESAAKFSFYLSAPVVCGAVVLELLDKATWTIIAANMWTFIIGILIAFIIGLLCIKYLLKYLQKHNFQVFMIYRLIMAAIVILFTIF